MRVASFISASILLAGIAPSDGVAQSAIVDLTKPQTGKSQYVLTSEFTPAKLGAADKEGRKEDEQNGPRIPACGMGCRMEQPTLAAAQPSQYHPAATRSSNGTRVIVIANTGKTVQPAATDTRRSSGFRIRFGRRR